MKKLVLFLIIFPSICGCTKDSFEIKGDPVNLISNDRTSNFDKSVILFHDNNYLIKTPLDSFILGHPFNLHDGYYDNYKNKAINDGMLKNTLLIYDYMPYKGDTIYTLAYHLEKGSCFMWDAHARKSIKTIYVEHYSSGGPMTSSGGRKFYIKDKLFFSTIDYISK